jgi:hypothetical protein
MPTLSCLLGKKNNNYQSCQQRIYLQNHTLGSIAVLFKGRHKQCSNGKHILKTGFFFSFLHKHKFTNSLQIDYGC